MKITEKYIINRIVKHLAPKWKVISQKSLHSHGCDIILTDLENKQKARRFLIECKAKSYSKSAKSVNETNFLFALGQIITRMNVIARHAYLYGLGLPEVIALKALKRIPWQAARNMCLYIFSIDDKGKVKVYSPKDIKRHQKGVKVKTLRNR